MPFIAALFALASCDAALDETPRQQIRYLSYGSRSGFAAELAARVEAALPHVELVTRRTPGSMAVVSDLEQGTGDVGFATADVVYLAYRRGTGSRLQPHTNLRAIAVRWINVMHVLVRRDSGLHSVDALVGKRVGIVAPGSSGELFARTVLEAHGLEYSALEPAFVPIGMMAQLVHKGELDAAILEAAPTPESVLSRAPWSDVRALPIRRAIINQIRSRYPFVKPVTVTAGHDRVETIGLDSVLICRKDLPEDVVYYITREVVRMINEVARASHSTRIDPENAPATPIPLHPGAARYHREHEILQ